MLNQDHLTQSRTTMWLVICELWDFWKILISHDTILIQSPACSIPYSSPTIFYISLQMAFMPLDVGTK